VTLVVTNQAGGTFAPGAGVAGVGTAFTNGQALVLSAGSFTVMKVQHNGMISDSAYAFNGSPVTYGGTLNVVTNAGDGAFTNGETFVLFNNFGSHNSGFAATNFPALSAGLAWSNDLANSGAIIVISNAVVGVPPVVAGLTNVTASAGSAPLSVTYSNLSSGATNYQWVFGDGNVLNTTLATNVVNTFSNAGIYTNILVAYGPGGTNAATNANYIVVTNLAPVAGFSGTPTNGFAPLAVVFTNSSSGGFTNSAWSFGNGNVATNTTGANVTNTYAAAGTYTVILTVSGPGGNSTNTQAAYIVARPRTVLGRPVLLGGTNFIFSGTNGPAGVQYRILATTNVAQALTNWTPVYTNVFAPDGSYTYTNTPATGKSRYFILVSP
jgi:PKD repeat protein